MYDSIEPHSGDKLGQQAQNAGRTARRIKKVASSNKSLQQAAANKAKKKSAAGLAGAAAGKKTVKGLVHAVTLKSCLISIGILILVVIVFGIISTMAFNITSSITHLNDPEQMSSGEDFLSYKNSQEGEETLAVKAETANEVFEQVLLDAYDNAYTELSEAAAAMGYILRYFPPYPDETTDEVLVMLYASYSASMQNAVSDEAFKYYQEINALDDMEAKLRVLLGLPHPMPALWPYGNYIYGSDFVRNADGSIAVTTETTTVINVAGETEEITISYVDGELSRLDIKSVTSKAFGFLYSDIYDDATISSSTYQDVIAYMCGPLSEMLYGAEWAFERAPVWALELGVEYGSVVDIALGEYGQYGGAPYWSWYGYDSRVAWCAIFVSWCADQAGVSPDAFPRFASCREGISQFKEMGRYQTSNTGYIPKTGDLIFFDWEPDGTVDHVGYVASCDGSTITTIEGNKGNYPGTVGSRTIAITSIYITGYAFPNYPAN